jgi:CubicO group peptidase (beta-lactamase class C family)
MADYEEAFARLDAFIIQAMEARGTPGVAVGLTDRERLLRVATYGYADLAARTPVTPDTLFEIGSIGKSFTSIAIQQAREAGLIDLHAPVTDYLPWFAVQSEYAPITIHHLLSHTAGIIEGTDFAPDPRAEVWALRETETGSPPGTYFHYSNVGYKALGLILERLLGDHYPAILRSRILAPLGMDATDPSITHETRHRLAVGYARWYDDRPGHFRDPLVPATWLETDSADGSLASTPADMAAYARLLLNRGQGPRGRLFSEESFTLMTQGVIKAWDDLEYGYGLVREEVEGHTYIGHEGDMVGYVASLLTDQDAGLGVVVLVNGPAYNNEMARFALQLLRAAREGQELPAVPSLPDPAQIENAADYAGTYRAGDKTITLAAEGDRLVLHDGAEAIPIEQRFPDHFYVPHPAWVRALLTFGRHAEQVVEAFHGNDWYTGEHYSGPDTFDSPPEWAAYVGHYRAYNPWFSNFRVLARKGQLLLSRPYGDEPLTPLAGGGFRVGEDAESPERLRFGAVVDGQALHAHRSGADFYRFFTP